MMGSGVHPECDLITINKYFCCIMNFNFILLIDFDSDTAFERTFHQTIAKDFTNQSSTFFLQVENLKHRDIK